MPKADFSAPLHVRERRQVKALEVVTLNYHGFGHIQTHLHTGGTD